MKLDPIEEVFEEVRKGRPVAIVDDENRENEADIMFGAECVTEQSIAFIQEFGKGMICFTLTEERMRKLNIPEQQRIGASAFAARYGASFDSRIAITSGGTAAGMAMSIREALRESAKPEDFVIPGHVFPIAGVDGGVLKRRGHTEASIDLARLSGLNPAAVICEVMAPDGHMLRGEEVRAFCTQHGLKLTSVEAILQHRLRNEASIRRVAECRWTDVLGIDRSPEVDALFENFAGAVQIIVYLDDVTDQEHFALRIGDPGPSCLVRIHSECLTGDVFGSQRCDCGEQLNVALKVMIEHGSGILIYLHQEGRGIGLANKLKAYELQDQGMDTVDANVHLGFLPDHRDYRVAAQMLQDLQLTSIRLMTNNPDKLESLSGLGIQIDARVPVEIPSGKYNEAYLNTKARRMGHLLS